MRFDVLTLFPELFAPFQTTGVTRRAFGPGGVAVRAWALRDFADNAYRRVDDRCYGGGPGMVMLVEPLERALDAVRADRADPTGDRAPRAPVILFSPAGTPLTQARVQSLAASDGAVLVCGRYEGIDQRFIDRHVDEEISVGDFVLSGGEIAALALLDAVARLQPGVLNDPESHRHDSFSDGLLDCPHYSRPERLGAVGVPADVQVDKRADNRADNHADTPAVLLSGHHAAIARWRRERQLELTARRRPELIAAARHAGGLSAADERFLASLSP